MVYRDIDGFVESVQYLRSRFGIESQQFDELNIVVDDAKRQIEVAQATFAKIGDALGDMRMVMAKRNLDRTAGDAKVKEVNSLNFENLNAEKEIELLQDAQKMLYGAISDYTAAMVQDELADREGEEEDESETGDLDDPPAQVVGLRRPWRGIVSMGREQPP